MKRVFAACGLFSLLLLSAVADEHTQTYKTGEEVVLWVNKVGPFRNPQETYKYFSLPWCHPKKVIETKSEGLGEALQGYELVKSGILLSFKDDRPTSPICTKKLSDQERKQFIYAVRNQYWYQLFLDNLPIWGMVGEAVDDGSGDRRYFIYTHKKFTISHNGNQIIEANLTSETPVDLGSNDPLIFTYSIEWIPTDTPFERRFDKYLDNSFFEHQIHWFSIFNSFMMVIFLTGLVSLILMRTLRKDYARYADEDEEDHDVGDDSGWKQVHGDVFRAPTHLVLFSASIGTGIQLAFLILFVICASFLGTYYTTRGTIVTAFILAYAFTSVVAGYVGGSYYSQNGGRYWIKTMLLTASLFPGVSFGSAFLLNFVAVSIGSLAAIPIGTMFAMLTIWAFISFPLTLIGTVVGKNWNGVPSHPCRIIPVPRQIPERAWYLQPWVNVFLGGILPFGSIFIEMYFIFTSFWHYKYYYVYGFMLLVYIILTIVTVCVTIVSTYFLLNAEDYRWQWVSFGSGASTAGYVYLYSIYYFIMKTRMSGFFQTSFYFGYMALFCFGLGMLCGAIGFFGSYIFVHRIYRNVKID